MTQVSMYKYPTKNDPRARRRGFVAIIMKNWDNTLTWFKGLCSALNTGRKATARVDLITAARLLFLQGGLVALVTSGSGLANSASAQDQSAQANDDAVEVEEIVVTGSRIARDGTTTTMPLTVVGSEKIQLTFEQNINDVLTQLPQFAPGANPTTGRNQTSNGAGLSLANLRALGINRTLVLVNGRRRVGGGALSTAVDLNTIPASIVDRVDVVTGGASSVYGADAVSGVVNITLDDDFEGVRLDFQTGATSHGDGETLNLSASAGKNFANDRGNITLGFTYDDSKHVPATARSFGFNERFFVRNPNAGLPGEPQNIHRDDLTFFFATKPGDFFIPGLFVNPDLGDVNGIFTEDGSSAREFNFGEGEFGRIGFNTGVIFRGDGESFEEWDNLRLPVERYVTTANLRYDLTDTVTFFTEATYADTSSGNFFQPNEDPLNFGQAPISIDNAFLPQQVRDGLTAAGLTSFGLNKIWTQFGRRNTESERDMYQITLGLDGEIGEGWSYEVFYAHGSSKEKTKQLNARLQSEFLRSLDSVIDPVTGNPICRENLGLDISARSDCVALNPFGIDTADPAAIEFSRIDTSRRDKISQRVVGGHVAGEWFNPFGAGQLGTAFGFEYREESANASPSMEQQAGLTLLPTLQNTGGDYDVKEVFGEVRVPLVTNKPFSEQLGVEAAVRLADYSTSGNTTSWHFGGDWAPTSTFRFRAIRSQAVRAANVGELFSPQFGAFQFFQDPCDSNFVQNGGSLRPENCATILGRDPATFNAPTNGRSPATTGGGNPNLDVETADTTTVGIVITPSFDPALSLTLDYWDIDLDDAIVTLGAGNIAALCVDQPLPNRFCDLVSRDAVTGGLTNVTDLTINAGALATSGYDLGVDYYFALGALMDNAPGDFSISIVGSYIEKRQFFGDPTDSENFREAAGYAVSPGGPLPKWQALSRTTYANGPLQLSWQMRYVDSLRRSDLDASNFLDIPTTGSKTIHDIAAIYRISEDVSIRAAVNNVFGTNPPLVFGAGVERGAGGLYPSLGTTFFVGASVNL